MSLLKAVTLFILFASVVSCSSTPKPDVILQEGPEGGVYLERLADGNVQAAHPIKISPPLMARVLNGIQVGNPKTTGQAFFSGNSKPERVFSEQDIVFLAPLLSAALLKATPEQQVRFRLVSFVSPISSTPGGGAGVGSSSPTVAGLQTEITAGTLYAHGLSLHVTLNEYRHRIVKPDVISGPNRYYPDTTGLKDREIQFTPQSAVRSDSYKQSDGSTLVIDYQSLEKRSLSELAAATHSAVVGNTTLVQPDIKERPILPEEPAVPSVAASSEPAKANRKAAASSNDEQMLKDLVIKKDLELETMKKELRALRRQLDERDAQLDALRKKIKPTTKSPDIQP